MAKIQKRRAPRSLGRAAAIGLSREKIVDAAISLIDQHGLQGFSMRVLARELKVFPTALYYHIGGAKAELFADISGRLLADLMKPSEVRSDWRDTLRLLFRRLRKRLHQHPNFVPALGAQIRSNGAPNAPWVEIILAALAEAGYVGKPLINAFNALVGGLEGYVTMELATMPSLAEEFTDDFTSRLQELDAAVYPLTVQYLPKMLNNSFVMRWKNGSIAPLDGGFETLLEGLILSLATNAPRVRAS